MKENYWVNQAWYDVTEKVKKTSKEIGAHFPSMTIGGQYTMTKDTWRWVTGFWPGLLWLLYEDSGYEAFKNIAENCEEQMDSALYNYVDLHHDVGFMWLLTSVKRYNLTGDEKSHKRALTAASHLASRFNCVGNYLVAWNKNDVNGADPRGLSIIDSTMNLPLLFWASKELNDPRFSHIAKAHGDTVLKHFIRDDGSVIHMIEFNPMTGEAIRVHSGQAYSETSAWARGAAWALYGMTSLYKETLDQKYLDAANKVADYFISQLPNDYVPYWDFRAPSETTIPRDTSAGACAACGLLELSKYVSLEKGNHYRKIADNMMHSMYSNYSNINNNQQGILTGGTFNYPKNLGINVSLIYGDYYFVEALYRLKHSS